ncbi:MAG: FAD-dependent monooxygenase [bacterium]|nr:FAD-dependent monooxygenase [bacterium]
MFRKKETDVIVAGAGPVGLFTAMALAERGIGVEILDTEWRTAGRSYALALHASALDLLDEMGLAEELIPAGHRVDTVAFYRGRERLGELRLGELERKYPFVLVLPQNRLEHALEEGLKRRKVKVHWNHRLAHIRPAGDLVDTRVDRLVRDSSGYALAETGWLVDRSFEHHTQMVIGADGHRSLVRQQLGIDFEKVGEPTLFAVFEFTIAGEAQHEVRVVLDEDATSVLWPLRDGRCRWSFQLPGAVEDEIPRIKSRFSVQIGSQPYPFVREENLEQFISQRAPWFAGKAEKIRWSLAVQFENRLAARFGQGRTWLVGDATHVTGPVGVQSMNVGMAEARELAELATDVVQQRAAPAALEEYGARWRGEWRDLLGLGRRLEARAEAPEWTRAAVDGLVPLVPAHGRDLEALLEQVGLGY